MVLKLLKLLSSSAYHCLKTSGFIKLSSERTLRDYTHFVKSKSGFHADLDKMLAIEVGCDRLPDWQKHIVLLMDEMKVKESLDYNKQSLETVGFTDIGEINNQLAELERVCNDTDKIHKPIENHI